MTRTLLAIVEGADHPPTAFLNAVNTMAAYQAAHLIIDVLTSAPLISPKIEILGTLPCFPTEVRQLVRDHLDVVRRAMPLDTKADVISHFDDIGWLPADLRTQLPLADLIVVGPRTDWASDKLRRHVLEALLFSSGTPILLLPAGQTVREVHHAVLGWTPSAPAARTMHELIDFAAPGANIDVVTVRDAGDDARDILDPVTTLLARHGFSARGHTLETRDTVHDTLLSYGAEQGADLLAIGGYSHSKLREAVFGGSSRSILDDPKLPVLMVH